MLYTACLRIQDVWLGLSDGYSEASFRWTDTKSLSDWANWESDPSGKTDKNCVQISGDKYWKTGSCTSEKYALCMNTNREYKLQ